MSGSDVLVRCSGVGRTFGSGRAAVVALHHASCAVVAGDRVALTGPSGSGKSTLLHLLAGLDVPSTGEVSWPALGNRAALRPEQIAIVFQGPSLLPPLDVVENVGLPLVLAGADPEAARSAAFAALHRLGLDDLGGKLPEELSGGQAQRVAIARAIASSARLILADEPTGQLDHQTAAEVVDALFEAVATTDAALVISTHDRDITMRFERRWSVADGCLRTDETCAT